MALHRRRHSRVLVVGVWVLCALLAANLIVTLARSGSSSNVAWAGQAPIAGGAGIFVMPGQITRDIWGVYLLDIDTGTLCVYAFFPGQKQLQFMAARDYRFDRRIKNYNTAPSPEEVEQWFKKQGEGLRGADAPPAGGGAN